MQPDVAGNPRAADPLRDTPIERTWAGRIAVTLEMVPRIHEPAPGVTAALGFSGRGIAMTSVMGRTLARKLLGADERTLPFPVVPAAPMPLHALLRPLVPLGAPVMSARDRLVRRLGDSATRPTLGASGIADA